MATAPTLAGSLGVVVDSGAAVDSYEFGKFWQVSRWKRGGTFAPTRFDRYTGLSISLWFSSETLYTRIAGVSSRAPLKKIKVQMFLGI
jgi:hypothetical protein